MNKFKKFYKNNRIYCILMLISLICLILMVTGVIVYFVNQATSDNYGNRLDGIENYPVDTDINNLNSYFKSDENVSSYDVHVQGKIIYIDLELKADLTNEEVESIATGSLEKMSDENKSFYDIQFICQREGLTPYLGSKSSTNSVISWNNYTFEDTSDEDKE